MADSVITPATYRSIKTNRLWWFYEIQGDFVVALEHTNREEQSITPYMLPFESVRVAIHNKQLVLDKYETQRFQYAIKEHIKKTKNQTFWRNRETLWNQKKS